MKLLLSLLLIISFGVQAQDNTNPYFWTINDGFASRPVISDNGGEGSYVIDLNRVHYYPSSTYQIGTPYLDKVAIFPKPSTFTFPAVIFRSTASEGLPLIIAAHGTGEAGYGGTKLWGAGLPKVLQAGFRPPYDVVIVCPQHTSYSIYPEHLPRIIQDMYERFKIDTNRIYLTGFSAGALSAYGSQFNTKTNEQFINSPFNVNGSFAPKIAGIVVMSGATQDINKTHWNWASAPIWAITGNTGTIELSYMEQNKSLVASINAVKPGLAKHTIRAGIGHSGWNEVYNATWKDNGVSIWDFFLGKTTAPAPIPTPTPTPLPTPLPPSNLVVGSIVFCGQKYTLFKDSTNATTGKWIQTNVE